MAAVAGGGSVAWACHGVADGERIEREGETFCDLWIVGATEDDKKTNKKNLSLYTCSTHKKHENQINRRSDAPLVGRGGMADPPQDSDSDSSDVIPVLRVNSVEERFMTGADARQEFFCKGWPMFPFFFFLARRWWWLAS